MEKMIKIPIARKEQVMRWIPCDEALPEEHQEVLISTKSGVYIAEFEMLNGNQCWSEAVEYRSITDVVAWMPLPDPYRKEDQNG